MESKQTCCRNKKTQRKYKHSNRRNHLRSSRMWSSPSWRNSLQRRLTPPWIRPPRRGSGRCRHGSGGPRRRSGRPWPRPRVGLPPPRRSPTPHAPLEMKQETETSSRTAPSHPRSPHAPHPPRLHRRCLAAQPSLCC
uniref:Uncharacterized protein n=1 Tax=Arundo donax TaxID=35708 RepID=A0A0A8XZB1_ARUDO